MTYAKGTSVAVERSREQLVRLLEKHGATSTAVGSDTLAGVGSCFFEMKGRKVRIIVPMPKRNEDRFRLTPQSSWKERSKSEQVRAWEQACRERWRCLLLLVKAKLELVELGISSFEREFLADIFLSDGRTVHEAIEANIADNYLDGTRPPRLLGS